MACKFFGGLTNRLGWLSTESAGVAKKQLWLTGLVIAQFQVGWPEASTSKEHGCW